MSDLKQTLNLAPNIDNADDFYADLLATHEGLSTQDSNALNARLILVLANHIGDQAVLRDALTAASLKQSEQEIQP